VAVEVGLGHVVAHGGARVGMAQGVLHVADADAGDQSGGAEGAAQALRVDRVRDAGCVSNPGSVGECWPAWRPCRFRTEFRIGLVRKGRSSFHLPSAMSEPEWGHICGNQLLGLRNWSPREWARNSCIFGYVVVPGFNGTLG
jgi:hypothetical protein